MKMMKMMKMMRSSCIGLSNLKGSIAHRWRYYYIICSTSCDIVTPIFNVKWSTHHVSATEEVVSTSDKLEAVAYERVKCIQFSSFTEPARVTDMGFVVSSTYSTEIEPPAVANYTLTHYKFISKCAELI